MQPEIGLAGTHFSSVQNVVPKSLERTGIKTGIACRRTTTVQTARKAEYASDGDKKVKIEFPANGNFDTRRSFITFDLLIRKTGGTYARLAQYADSWITTAKLLSNSSTTLHIQENYNEIASLLKEMVLDPDVRATYGKWLGIGTEAERNGWGAAVKSYCLPLYSNLLNTENIVTKALKVPLELELTIDDPERFIETDGDNPQVTISNVEFHLDTLEFDPSYEAAIVSDAMTGQTIGFRTWTRNEFNVSGNSSCEFDITQKNSSVNGLLNIFKDTSNQYDTTVNDKFRTFPVGPGGTTLNFVQLKFNTKNFYEDKLDMNKVDKFIPFQKLSRWCQDWKFNGFMKGKLPIHQDNFGDDKFVQIDDFEAYPEEIDLVNAFNTLGANVNIKKRFEFSGIVPDGWNVHVWVESFQITTLMPDGSVRTIS